jgi:hypothetical protein
MPIPSRTTGRSYRPFQVRACLDTFFTIKLECLIASTKNTYLTCTNPAGEGSHAKSENWQNLVGLFFKENIMISLAASLVCQFYTYIGRFVRPKEVLNRRIKNNLISFFRINNVKRSNCSSGLLRAKESRCLVEYKHTGPTVVLITSEASRSKISTKNNNK